jgi:hypothetical protein
LQFHSRRRRRAAASKASVHARAAGMEAVRTGDQTRGRAGDWKGVPAADTAGCSCTAGSAYRGPAAVPTGIAGRRARTACLRRSDTDTAAPGPVHRRRAAAASDSPAERRTGLGLAANGARRRLLGRHNVAAAAAAAAVPALPHTGWLARQARSTGRRHAGSFPKKQTLRPSQKAAGSGSEELAQSSHESR